MSAYSSLKFLESKIAENVENTKIFSVLKEKDAWDGWDKIAEQHWKFWKDIETLN